MTGNHSIPLDRAKRPGEDRRPVLFRFIAGIPSGVVVGIGKMIGLAAYTIDWPHRRIIRRNLKFAFPDWSPSRIRQVARQVFQNFGITAMEIFQLAGLSRETILKTVRISGENYLHDAMTDPRGVILISAHQGNWEVLPLFTACYFGRPVSCVMRPLETGILDRWIRRIRTRFGNRVLEKDGAFSEMSRTLRGGGMVGIVIDQGTKSSEGIEATLFNRKVTATPGAALLAMRCRSPVLPMYCVRDPDNGLRLVVEPPVTIQRTGNMRMDLKVNTQLMMTVIERIISRHPDQWFWFHKRWKKHYPELYPEYVARRKRRKAREKERKWA